LRDRLEAGPSLAEQPTRSWRTPALPAPTPIRISDNTPAPPVAEALKTAAELNLAARKAAARCTETAAALGRDPK